MEEELIEVVKTTPGQRLKMARQSRGLTLRQFAEPLSVAFQTVHNWEKGISPIPLMAAGVIARIYGISFEWLLDGAGEPSVQKRDMMNLLYAKDSDENWLDVPFISLKSLSKPIDHSSIRNRNKIASVKYEKEWLQRRFGAASMHLFIAEAIEDSMATTINPSDLVWVDQSAFADGISGFMNGIWVFRVENVIHVKRVQHLGSDKFQATSENPAYKPFLLKKPCDFIGRVVSVDKRV